MINEQDSMNILKMQKLEDENYDLKVTVANLKNELREKDMELEYWRAKEKLARGIDEPDELDFDQRKPSQIVADFEIHRYGTSESENLKSFL